MRQNIEDQGTGGARPTSQEGRGDGIRQLAVCVVGRGQDRAVLEIPGVKAVVYRVGRGEDGKGDQQAEGEK